MSSTSTTWTVDTETTGSVLTTRLSGDVTLSSGDKLYLDGGTHTYFTEASNDIVKLYAGVDNAGDVREYNMSPKSGAGVKNTVYGQSAGANIDANTISCTYFGAYAGDHTHDDADGNTGIGALSLSALTTGKGNTLVGRTSGYSMTTSLYSTAIGSYALQAETIGGKSVAVGYNALGSQNRAGEGDVNARNVGIGYYGGKNVTTGKDNTMVGWKAGYDADSPTRGTTTGSENVFIGGATEASASTTDNEIVIGYNVTGKGANKTVIGNADNTDVYLSSDQGAAVWLEHINMLERSSDPTEPTEGHAVIWMSNGSGKGDDGDIMIASQAGGATKYATLFDHSGGSSW